MKVVKKTDARTDRLVKGDTVIVHHMTAHESLQEGEGFQHQTTLDFSNCTREQILLLAADAAIIAARQKLGFKIVTPDAIPTEIDVSKMLQGGRNKVNKVDKAVAQMAKLTGKDEAEIREMLANLK